MKVGDRVIVTIPARYMSRRSPSRTFHGTISESELVTKPGYVYVREHGRTDDLLDWIVSIEWCKPEPAAATEGAG